VVLPVKQALFVSAVFVSDAENQCKSVGAFKLPSGRILLLLPSDNRPSEDQLVVVVLDGNKGSVVEVVGNIGAYGGPVLLVQETTGFRTLLLRKWFNNLVGGGEFGAPDWMSIRETKGRLDYKWETKRP
jgi:hypothetical protein